MDIATIVGLILGIGLVLGSIFMGGGGLGPFINVPSMMITIGGSIAAILINFPMKSCLGLFGVIKKCFTVKLPTAAEVIEIFKDLSSVVRSEGMLALEGKLETIDDAFLKRGLELVISGAPQPQVETALETEVAYVDQRHEVGKKIVDAIAAAAPAFGMIGTLIGLVQMLRTLDDPSKIGIGMATALLTTLYGALIANLLCIPLGGKLEARNQEEILIRDLMISGIGGLMEGATPRAMEERLVSYISPKVRDQMLVEGTQ